MVTPMACPWPRLAGERLEKELGPTTIYNLGAPWHTSLHSLYKAWTYVDQIEPDCIVVMEAVNDFYKGFTHPSRSLPVYRSDYSHCAAALSHSWEVGSSTYDGRPCFIPPLTPFFRQEYDRNVNTTAGFLSDVKRMSVLWFKLQPFLNFSSGSETGPVFVDMKPEEYLRSLPAFQRNYKNIVLTARVKKIPLIFLTQPFTTDGAQSVRLAFYNGSGNDVLSDACFVKGMKTFNEFTRSLDDGRSVRVCDLEAKIMDPVLFADEVHLHEPGVNIEADLFADFFIANFPEMRTAMAGK